MSKPAAARIARARSILVTTNPFFGCLALHLDPVERADVGTMAVDGRHLFYSPAFVESLSEPELIGVIAHEVHHCAYGHHARIGSRDLKTFNAAADYAINRDLLAAGFTLPAGGLVDSRFDGMGAEEIYSILTRGQDKPEPDGQDGGQGDGQDDSADASQAGQDGQGQAGEDSGTGDAGDGGPPQAGAPSGQDGQSGQDGAEASGPDADGQGKPANGQGGQPGGQGGQPGQGTGADAPADPGAYGMGGIMRPASAADAAEESDRWQVLARQAANVAKAQAGTVPGYLRDMLAELGEPRQDFRELLANWIDSRVACDYSFARPNRRYVHAGVYMPGVTVDGLEHVIFAVDTSGSITAAMIETAAAEIVGAMESGKIQRLTVLMADTRVCSVAEFEKGDDVKLEPAGGGGTDFRATFQWIADNAPDASAVVYLTDLEVSEFGEEPDMPVLWATHGDSRRFRDLAARVPFGEAVYIGRL